MLIYSRKLRFLACFCLVLPASPTFFNGLIIHFIDPCSNLIDRRALNARRSRLGSTRYARQGRLENLQRFVDLRLFGDQRREEAQHVAVHAALDHQ